VKMFLPMQKAKGFFEGFFSNPNPHSVPFIRIIYIKRYTAVFLVFFFYTPSLTAGSGLLNFPSF